MTATRTHFQIFAWLWAAATLFDLGKWGNWAASPGEFLLFLSACALLLHASSVPRLVLVAAVQVGIALWQLPFLSNHRMFSALVSATIVGSLLSLWIRHRTWRVAPADLLTTFAPVVRAELILLYAIAAFHKLNSDWFNLDVSCAIVLHDRILEHLAWLRIPPVTHWGAIYLGIGLEALLAVLLIGQRSRPIALCLGGLFHVALGLVGFFRFSALMFALYWLFVPADYVDRALVLWARSPARRRWMLMRHYAPSWQWMRRAATILLVLLTVVVVGRDQWRESSEITLLVRDSSNQVSRSTLGYAFQAAWLAWSIGLLCVFTRLAFARSEPGADGSRLSAGPAPARWLWVFPALVVLNGLAPYLGLKTDSSFSMFSNLRTSAPGSNHLLITRPLALVPFADDLVRVEASSDAELGRVSAGNYQLPWFELASYVQHQIERGHDFALTFAHHGVRRDVASVRLDRELFQKPSWLARKLLYFRPVHMDAFVRCSH